MISLLAQCEQNMNAVERVLHYAELPPEEKDITPDSSAKIWPENGSIVFEDVSLVYREGLPLVLTGINFRINAGRRRVFLALGNVLYLNGTLDRNCWTYWIRKKLPYPGLTSMCGSIPSKSTCSI
jgi:hypothetical protein